jgi:hypothetical protein
MLMTAVASQPMPAGAAPSSSAQILPPGAIQNVMVIDLENESFSATFGDPTSYLNQTLAPQGELLKNYYATGHVSLDNYVAQVSGQSPNFVSNSDCIGSTGAGTFNDVVPGTLDANQAAFPGQVDGQGCVYPASVQTIGNQLDAAYPTTTDRNWRVYAEDMGNVAARDGGTPDPLGGTDCAHPAQTSGQAADNTNSAVPADQYATRHNPMVYFHSVIDDAATCNRDVVPLGMVAVGTGGAPDAFSGHLAQDLASSATTPRFSFVSPNLCNDGHDSQCAGTNAEGTTAGGLTAVNIWLKHWMPLILGSPAYRSGQMLVVITADEGNIWESSAGDSESAGPNNANPGYSPILNAPAINVGGGHFITYYQYFQSLGLMHNAPAPSVTPAAGTMPGGGQIGALLLNPSYVHVGTTDATGSYNHYSALRTYEDLLGITSGGADGRGHLGFAASATSFGTDVFVDSTPPVLTLPSDMTLEATSSSGAVASYSAAAADNVDGSDAVSCTPASGSTFALGTTSVSCSSSDAAGNTATGSFSVHVVDTTPPRLQLPAGFTTGPTSVAGAPVTYTASATDVVDGSDPVACTPASGATFGFGTTIVSCSSTDAAGNTATGTFNVTITGLTFSGFYQPVDNAPIVNTVKSGATVPVKWSLSATGNEVSSLSAVAAGYPKAVSVSCATGVTYDAIDATSTGGTSLRYDSTAHQYVYNWQSPAQKGTCWRLDIKLVDGTVDSALFKLT